MQKTRDGVIDLFSGVGGFAHAVTDPRFGLRVLLSVDIDPDAAAVYGATVPGDHPHVDDIRALTRTTANGQTLTPDDLADAATRGVQDYPLASSEEIRRRLGERGVPWDHVRLITSGWPCQPWSKARGTRQDGHADPRGTLIEDMLAMIEAIMPDTVIAENVPNIVSARHRAWYDHVLDRLNHLGYATPAEPILLSPDRLHPELMGTPQIRKRMLLPAVKTEGDRSPRAIDVDALSEMFTFDPDRWDPQDILDADESFDTGPYMLTERQRLWVSAWNALLQELTVDDLPGELYVDTFSRDWAPDPCVDPAARARMLRSHAFYRDDRNRKVIDQWTSRTWLLAGEEVTVRDFPRTRRVLEWQARAAQPTARDRDLWATTFSFRPSGIRVRPLTALPALVALNTTSAIGPRGRFITPREAARLMGLPVPAVELPVRKGGVTETASLPSRPPVEEVRTAPVTNLALLAVGAREVCDLWWTHGGHHPSAVDRAMDVADACGATAGEVILAAGALAARQPRWRGSTIRWTRLAWDTYRVLAPAHPVSWDPALASVDWRYRRRSAWQTAQTALAAAGRSESDPVGWLMSRVDMSAAANVAQWRLRGRSLAHAARADHVDVEWGRGLLRGAVLSAWDGTDPGLEALAAIDEELSHAGVLRPRPLTGAGSSRRAADLASQLPAPALPAPHRQALNIGAGMPGTTLPLTGQTLEDGRRRMGQLEQLIRDGAQRAHHLRSSGQCDPRTEAQVVTSVEQYISAAWDLRRHPGAAGDLWRAAALVSELYAHRESLAYAEGALEDPLHALLGAWAGHVEASPGEVAGNLVLPLGSPEEFAPPGDDLLSRLAHADHVAQQTAGASGPAGMVVAAHYERTRTLLAQVLDRIGRGQLDEEQSHLYVYATTRLPGGVPGLVNQLEQASGWLEAAQGAHVLSADTFVQAAAAGLLGPQSTPDILTSDMEAA